MDPPWNQHPKHIVAIGWIRQSNPKMSTYKTEKLLQTIETEMNICKTTNDRINVGYTRLQNQN